MPLNTADANETLNTPHRCPRRDEAGAMPTRHDEQPDGWRTDPLGPSCTFCGSLHPDTFLAAIETGHELIPTDKNYKAYVRSGSTEAKFYFQHLSPAQRTRLIELSNTDRIRFAHPGFWYVLPFFTVRRAGGSDAPQRG